MVISVVDSGGSSLTPREREILAFVAKGESAKQIAMSVGLAPRTVERYIENIRHKLGARNRSHLVALAVACGELTVTAAPR